MIDYLAQAVIEIFKKITDIFTFNCYIYPFICPSVTLVIY